MNYSYNSIGYSNNEMNYVKLILFQVFISFKIKYLVYVTQNKYKVCLKRKINSMAIKTEKRISQYE